MQLRPVDRWEWLDLVRRARLGRTTKLVAVMLALYANEDGSRVFPGTARLAVVCELGYNTVKDHLAVLRDRGWIERVAKAGARGRADEYRLTVSDGEEVPTPGQIDAEIERLRSAKAGYKPRPQPGARAEVPAAKPVDNSEPQPGARAEVEPDSDQTSARLTGRGEPTSARLTGEPQPGARAATNHVPRPVTTPDHPTADLRTAVTVSREAGPQDPISDVGGEASVATQLRLIAGNPDAPSPDVTPGRPRTALRGGFGFCMTCYADGKTVLAADPVNGSACMFHIRNQEAS